MAYDFDKQLALRGTHATKYDAIEKVYGTSDPEIIPMWVADMDFAAAPAILEALRAEIERGFCGYYGAPEEASEAVANWYKNRHGWDIDPSWVRYTHGVISGYADVIATYSEPGDGVIVFSPVYHAFFRQITAMGRNVVESPLVLRDGQFHMDLDALESSLTGKEKIVTFCTPHNPGGRIWTKDEIGELMAFCAKHDLMLISDEIHMDLVFPGAKFTPTPVASANHLDRIVVLSAASKGFNLAGGETAFLIAPDAKRRTELDRTILDRESSPNRYGMAMMTAAFAQSGDWSDAVCAYIAENFRIFAQRVGALPGVNVMDMQSTYLSWVDFTGTGMNDKELMDRVLNQAKVAPNPGTQFGHGGTGHLRFNLALPRPTMLKAIEQIEAAFSDLQ